ncbi:MAG: DUF4250 domain-containing protein [Clostridia bacterium]|nr:DUF4250 domain-containing protein [Clostridia bacterium]
MIPNDPIMLLSFMNMKLRDYGKNLEQLCEDLDVSEEQICTKLGSVKYRYDAEKNQFLSFDE